MIRRSYDSCMHFAFFLMMCAAPTISLAASPLAPQVSQSKSGSTIPKVVPASTAEAKPTLPSLDSVRVTGVERWDKKLDSDHPGVVAAGLQQIIVIHVDSLYNLVKRSGCQSERGSPVEGCTP